MRPREASTLVGTAQFLDVREPYEYEAGHVEGSLHIPIGEVATRVSELDSEVPVVVVCQVGQRSALVTEWLRGQGFQADNLEGGLADWITEGFPLTAAESDSGEVIDGWARDLTGERLNPDP
jgi:rhodanese-related sulfurtransferase